MSAPITLIGVGDSVTVSAAKSPPPPGTWKVETPLSVNTNTVLYGQSLHNWGDGGVIGKLSAIGCKRFHGVWAYGPNRSDTFDIQDQYIRDARALGITPSFTLLDPNYGTSSSQASKLSALARSHPGLVWTVGNECSNTGVTPTQYLSHLKMAHDALKAGDPSCDVCGPAITGLGLGWEQSFLALNPWQWLDSWNRHTYYGTPEDNFANLLNQVPQMIAKSAGREVPMYIEEVGWALESRDQTGSGAVGFTESTRTNYASRYLFLAAATRNLRALTLYAAKDEGQPLWGAYDAAWSNVYPYAAALRDASVHVHAATGAAVYKRGQSWFVRMDTPTGQRLAIWNPTGPSAEKIFALSTLGVKAQTIGSTTVTTYPVPPIQQISVGIGPRAVVLTGASFPEFT